MADIVERLRAAAMDSNGREMHFGDRPRDVLQCGELREAADNIELLRKINADQAKEIERLQLREKDLMREVALAPSTGSPMTDAKFAQIARSLVDHIHLCETALANARAAHWKEIARLNGDGVGIFPANFAADDAKAERERELIEREDVERKELRDREGVY